MKLFDTGDVRLHYRVDGPDDGAPVVFANSLGTDMRLWDPILPLLPVLLTRRGAVVDIICSARQIDRFLGAGRPQGGGVTRALRRAPEELFAARQRSCC